MAGSRLRHLCAVRALRIGFRGNGFAAACAWSLCGGDRGGLVGLSGRSCAERDRGLRARRGYLRPRCGADVTESGKGFFCSSRACRFALWKDARFWQAKDKKLDKKIAATLLSEGRVFFSDLKSGRTGKTYAAAVVLEDDGVRVNFKLDFQNKDTGRKSA